MARLDNAELGKRLREARLRKGLTIENAAAWLGGVDLTVISKMETGRRNIDAIELGRLAELYDVSTDAVLDSTRHACPMCQGRGWISDLGIDDESVPR